jgi:hypothetical protein
VGFVVDKGALGQVSSEHFGFPANSNSTKCSILIYQGRGGARGQLVADVPSGLSPTPPQETKQKKRKEKKRKLTCFAGQLFEATRRLEISLL